MKHECRCRGSFCSWNKERMIELQSKCISFLLPVWYDRRHKREGEMRYSVLWSCSYPLSVEFLSLIYSFQVPRSSLKIPSWMFKDRQENFDSIARWTRVQNLWNNGFKARMRRFEKTVQACEPICDWLPFTCLVLASFGRRYRRRLALDAALPLSMLCGPWAGPLALARPCVNG